MSIEGVKKRTAERKAAGLIPVYSHGKKKPMVKVPVALPVLRPPCVHEGAVLEFCPTCGNREGRHVRDCSHPANPTERCTRDVVSGAVRACATCTDYRPGSDDETASVGVPSGNGVSARSVPDGAPPGERGVGRRHGKGTRRPEPMLPVTRIDPARLAPVADGRRFNASTIDFAGTRLMAYRVGWTRSTVHVATLGADLQPTATVPIELAHPRCAMGQEDPRLFIFGGALHLAFAGLEWARGRLIVSQMLARLSPDLKAERVWEPKFPQRTFPMEKNWQFFEVKGELYAVYAASPEHVILRIDVAGGTASVTHRTTTLSNWKSGVIRGGAPPVRVGDEFYHWFHGWERSKRKGTPHGDWYEYAVGVYTFDAKPPFKVRRMTPRPVWRGDSSKLALNVTRDKNVIYPSGAVLDGARWLVSAGHQDAECVIGQFAVADVERQLESVT